MARAGEVDDHTALGCPQIHVPRYKFAAIVHPDRLRIWAVEHRSSPQRMNALPNLSGSPSSALCRSEEHTSELQSLMRISYAVFCLKKKNSISGMIAYEILRAVYCTIMNLS